MCSHLGRALGHFILALIGLKRILFANIFSKAFKAPPSHKGLTRGSAGENRGSTV